MMANLFKNITLPRCQQLRFLPRFSQAGPDSPLTSKNTWDEEIKERYGMKEPVPKERILKSPDYAKFKPSFKLPASLVIKSTRVHETKAEKPLTVTQKVKINEERSKEFTIDNEGNLNYTKMQNNDVRINKIMSYVKTQNKERTLMLLEGKRLIKEALDTGCELEYIFFSRMKEIDYLKHYLPKNGGKLYKMPYKEMQTWSDLTTNPGIMGIFKIPPADHLKPKEALPLTIICDNIREPSNLGAILRISSGVGCERVVLTKGCVNIWETKVLRTACGAHFKVSISKEATWDNITSSLPENASVFIADNNTVTSSGDCLESIEDMAANIPVLPYFSMNFSLSNHIVLIIGGETQGISVESYKLAKDLNGVRLNVPLSNGVDSLNTGTALGIIAFEIKRQLTHYQASKSM